MSKLVTLYGGSGFVGRYIARRLSQQGWRIRVAVRRPNEAMHVKPYGAPGQVEPVLCNIRDDASVRAALQGADAVVNCVGTFDATGKNNFDAVQHQGAARIARIAAESGVAHMVHISAIGADLNGASLYQRSKALGEQAVLQHMPNAMILRPSVIFGNEDGFFNRFGAMAANAPVLPLVGADTLFQPVYVDDVAGAAVLGATGQASGTFELGGPDVASFRALMQQMLAEIRRKRVLINVPFFAAKIMGTVFDILQKISFGLFTNGVLTRDQVRNLARDNVVADGARGFADLGITPTPMSSVLPEYLYAHRVGGQYKAIHESAERFRKS